jgi:alpha-methylacyl-CoA racemase
LDDHSRLILADYGADVVRIDRLVTPFGPPRDTLCRHKRSIVIDFKHPPSRDAFLELVRAADILIDPYRPGVMARLGLGSDTLLRLNPRLIYAHLHGFRPDGIYGARAGHDINYLAVSGILSILGRKGEKPAPPANVLGDFAGGGLVCVTGILMALMHRLQTGKGQVVTANMVDGSAYLATFPRQQHGRQNMDRPRGENLLDGAAPFYEVYETKDGRFVAVGAQEPQFYAQLLAGLGLDQDNDTLAASGLGSGGGDDKEKKKNKTMLAGKQWDREHWPETKEVFARVFRTKSRDEWRQVFDGTDACVSPVLEFGEVERPHKPLVELSETPSLDVSVQEDFPELKKGQGCLEVLKEWVPEMGSDMVVDEASKLLTLKGRRDTTTSTSKL